MIVVRRAIVLKRTKKTKTNRIRQVELVDEALTALTRQKSRSFMAGSAVFLSPLDGLPFTTDQTLRKKYWVPSLKRAGVRERGPYHTRHTYATAALIAGCNVAWVAKQLGHSTPATTLAKYARWIEGDDAGRELSNNLRRIRVRYKGRAELSLR